MRHSVFRRLAVAALACVAAASVTVSPWAGATPQNDYERAKAELKRLGQEWNSLADRYSANANKLYALDRNVSQTEAKVEELKALVEQKRNNIGAQARSVYKHGSVQIGTALNYLLSPAISDDMLRANKYMDEIQGKTRDVLNALRASEEDLDAELVVLNNDKREQTQLVAELKSSSDEIKSRIAQQEEITAQHRERIEAERAAAEQAKRQAAAERTAAQRTRSSSGPDTVAPSSPGPAGTSGGSSGGASFSQGQLAPWAAAYGDMLRSNYGGISSIGGWRASGSVTGSDHPKGLAIDVMTSGASGDAIAARAASDIGSSWRVKYVIWNRRYYSGGGSSPYSGPSPHSDHVHISFY